MFRAQAVRSLKAWLVRRAVQVGDRVHEQHDVVMQLVGEIEEARALPGGPAGPRMPSSGPGLPMA
jgi:hypothetical protein